MDWAIDLLKSYWPAIFILVGIGCFISGILEDEIGFGIFGLLFYGAIGVVLLVLTPGRIWAWLVGFAFFQFLITGEWYEIVLKVGGAIGVIALIGGILKAISR